MSGPHDVGGLSFDAEIPREQHAFAPWELRVDAMMQLLTDPSRPGGPKMTVDELRRGVESLTAEDYHRLGYYQRWVRSIAWIMVERGHLEASALMARIAGLTSGEHS
jgi:hypothetical protein